MADNRNVIRIELGVNADWGMELVRDDGVGVARLRDSC
jgi:hypothetical protein